MSKAAVTMLKGLMAQIESGELVVTDASVSSDTVELQGGAVRPTGEHNWYITTRPAARAPEMPKIAAILLGNKAVGSSSSNLPALAHRPHNVREVCDEVDCLTNEYQSGHIRIAELYDRAVPLYRKLTGALSSYAVGSLEYAQLVRATGRLGRTLYV